jgi:hypothetical protein
MHLSNEYPDFTLHHTLHLAVKANQLELVESMIDDPRLRLASITELSIRANCLFLFLLLRSALEHKADETFMFLVGKFKHLFQPAEQALLEKRLEPNAQPLDINLKHCKITI